MKTKPHTIHVVVVGGLVQEVRNIPPGIEVQVVDYDIETVEDFDLQISPLDGAACSIQTYKAESESIKPVLAQTIQFNKTKEPDARVCVSGSFQC
jgi:hypothetical protein